MNTPTEYFLSREVYDRMLPLADFFEKAPRYSWSLGGVVFHRLSPELVAELDARAVAVGLRIFEFPLSGLRTAADLIPFHAREVFPSSKENES